MAEKRQAVALQYDKANAKKGAPRVVAVGEGRLAEKIIEIAQEHNVPLYEDVQVVARLVKVSLGDEIPAELYQAVAKILFFLYQLDEEKQQSKTSSR
ncbi:MAG: EscU/YscU/HrcU family type III secretion system export apparatus switch protein [Peptococcia bacterium]